MLEAIKQLLESNVITEDTHEAIQSAWATKLTEAKEAVRTELREEFANRYEHDKKVMVESLDKMVSEGLKAEIAEFAQERADMRNDRVARQKLVREQAAKFEKFMTVKLAEEISELRADRRKQSSGMKKLDKFVSENLRQEIKEFAQDKRELVEAKVRLVSEAKSQLESLKRKFVDSSAKKLQEHVNSKLRKELTTLNEDIKAARENSFGRRIFEAFSKEFSGTLLNENAEIRKLKKLIAEKNTALRESKVSSQKLRKLTESKEKELRKIKENAKREKIIEGLVSSLNKDRAEVMRSLLEHVKIDRIQTEFDKYLPAVIAEKETIKPASTVLNESRRVVTGNKPVQQMSDDNIVDIKKLAGL